MVELSPERLTLRDFFAAACNAHAERVAIRFEGRSITYREILIEAAELRECKLPSYCLGTDEWRRLLRDRQNYQVPAILPEDDALIIYTSGTTADPKGILHRQRAPIIRALHYARYLDLEPNDRMWTV